MFQHALQIAQRYTLPVVISRRRANDKATSQIASFIVLNDEGWILTAHHVVKLIQELAAEKKAFNTYRQHKADIVGNPNLTKAQRKKRLRKLDRPPKNPTTNYSVWWGQNRWAVHSFKYNARADLAVGQLAPFDAESIITYPTFKKPTKEFLPGTSLCKLGFPFHSITPTYEQDTQRFKLPPGSLPVPRFPIEGIFTRILLVDGPETDRPWPIKFVETSSPGLRGQSGGPTLDVMGRIWAMQSRTVHYPMGFSPDAPGKKTKEHQFLNVGRGVHAETIMGFLDSLDIRYDMSEED